MARSRGTKPPSLLEPHSSEVKESDTQPQPPEDSEDDRVRRIFVQPQVPRAKPEWWTEAWSHLEGVKLRSVGYIQLVCPLVFKDEAHMDVYALDEPGSQT